MNLRYRDERVSALRTQARGHSPASRPPAFHAACSSCYCKMIHDRPVLVVVQGGKTGVEGPGLSTRQRLAYGLVLVGGRYVWARLSLLAAAQRWGDAEARSWRARAWRCMRRAEVAAKLASLANLLAFLRYGAYRWLHLQCAITQLLKTRSRSPYRGRPVEHAPVVIHGPVLQVEHMCVHVPRFIQHLGPSQQAVAPLQARCAVMALCF